MQGMYRRIKKMMKKEGIVGEHIQIQQKLEVI